MPDSTSIIYDWQFWSAIAAFLALLLTQLPPIKHWFKSDNLIISIHSNLQVTHKIGNPNLGTYLTIENTGGRSLQVKDISLSIYRDENLIGQYPARSYFETPTSNIPIMLIPFKLAADESWGHSTMFLNNFDRATNQRVRNSESALRTDIRHKLNLRPENDNNPVVAEQELVDPFIQLFNQLFVWEPGEYRAVLNIRVDRGERTFSSSSYRFTLFESESQELRSHTEDYKFGGGLSYNVDRHIGIFVPLTMNE